MAILMVLRDKRHPAGHNTIEYIKLNIASKDSIDNVFNILFQSSFDSLINKRFIESYAINIHNSGLPQKWVTDTDKIYYYITPEGLAALKHAEIHGLYGGGEEYAIDAMLGYMKPYSVYNLDNLKLVLEPRKISFDNDSVMSFFLAHGLAEDLGNNSIKLTKKGRRLWRKGSIKKYFEDVRFRIEVKKENRELENKLLKSQIVTNENTIETNTINKRLLRWTTIFALLAVLISAGSLWVSVIEYRRQAYKEDTEQIIDTLHLKLKSLNFGNGLLKNENDSLKSLLSKPSK